MDKKISAKEAAVAVLQKAEEMLKSSNLAKADILHENVASKRMERAAGYKERGDELSHKIAVDGAKESHKEQLDTIKAQPKPNLPKSEEASTETPNDLEAQPAPEDNQHEKSENGNPAWGQEPGTYKLAKFTGHMSAKRKAREQK